jgi:hypothetical protein
MNRFVTSVRVPSMQKSERKLSSYEEALTQIARRIVQDYEGDTVAFYQSVFPLQRQPKPKSRYAMAETVRSH